MKKEILSRSEILARAGVGEKTLAGWEERKLVRADGATSEGVPLYSEGTLDRIVQIKNLLELGYGSEAVEKIIKKIGLPRSDGKGPAKTSSREFLTVGALAERIGASPRAIKHWEDKGIIEPDMRSEGGFRLYADHYVFLCKLLLDLQLFGYTLEEIKAVSDLVRTFVAVRSDPTALSRTETDRKFEEMLAKINALFEKMSLLKEGIGRWEDLLKKRRKEILHLKEENAKSRRAKPGKDRP